jgi:hypothetical protein
MSADESRDTERFRQESPILPEPFTRKTTVRKPRDCPLPVIKNIAWEAHQKGGWECWHVPRGVTERSGKTYLGYFGKKLLAYYLKLSRAERRSYAVNWVTDARCKAGVAAGKGFD